ncbi:AraC family transcriptional regulator [Priestia megaterium]|nr:AraC family transcriptional regulator [Priestia megaterium]PFB03944.1 AraC family transcriptional regulator [Priestia megaterium]PFR93058.1 AraC family transcriptional regulator [Priestia megaterium]TCN09987.1 AraC-like DNA-binding protein [Bacillus sp. BK006]CAH0218286.1 HTH-type transcriptional regulator YesS [Priestia megaterium]
MDRMYFPALSDEDMKLPFYVTSAGSWRHQTHIKRQGEFPDYQWIQCLKGRGELRVNDEVYIIKENEGMFLTPHVPHEYYPVTSEWQVCWVSFNGSVIDDIMLSLQFINSGKIVLTNAESLYRMLQELMDRLEENHTSSTMQCSELLYSVILKLRQDSVYIESKSRLQQITQLNPVLRYIEEYYHQPLTLEVLAQQLNVTEQYTCLLFQQSLGIRPFEYVTRVRIQKAKKLLLKNNQISVQDIARQVGYEHPSYFIKRFKEQENVTPTIFRKMYFS